MNMFKKTGVVLLARRSRAWSSGGTRLVPALVLLLGGAGVLGCGDNQDTQLQEILNDGDLGPMLTRGGLTLAAPGDGAGGAAVGGAAGAAAGGRGGAPASGGATGFDGGVRPDGAISDGGIQPDVGGVGGAGGVFFPPDGGGMAGKGGQDGGGQDGGGQGGGGGFFPNEAQGRWRFEECFSGRTELRDSNAFEHTAYRSVSVDCAVGLSGLGVAIDGADDYVYVPDQPDFTFQRGVTAAAWVKPAKLGDIRTIFRKRESGTSSFVLLSNGRDYQFVIRLENGRAVQVSARGKVNEWTHVAGTYDGQELRLYLNGSLAARTRAAGTMSSGAGPLLMGNDANGRRIDGLLDDVFFDTVAITAEQVAILTCVNHPPTIAAVPTDGPMVPAGTAVSYDVTITNNDSARCAPRPFGFQAFSETPAIITTPSFEFIPELAAGESTHLALSVSSTAAIEPDTHRVTLQAFANSEPFDFAEASITYSVQGTPCSVRSRKELMIRDVSVVDDPVRTAPGGAWTFGKLMENLAPSAAEAPDMVEAMLSTWLTDQTVNGQVIPARPAMQNLVLSSFPRTASGKLDLSRTPVRLLAIVNRMDLRDVAQGHAGEGRFVFGVLDPGGFPTQFTMIFEFRLPASSAQDVIDWANRWHGLSELPFPSAEYNAALQAITDRFTGRGADPGRINGSALAQLRTNEIALSFEWQFREFHLSAATHTLVPALLALTPGRQFNGTQTLADYINANEADIIAERHTVPETFGGQSFRSGSVTNDLRGWDVGAVNPEARQKFSVNTCNGCHSARETNTFFLQVNPRAVGQEAPLSTFLTGTSVLDGQARVIRSFNDLGRRNRDLHLLLCPGDDVPPLPPDVPIGGAGGRGVPPDAGVVVDGGRGVPGDGPIGTGSGGSTGAGGMTGMMPPAGGTGGASSGGGFGPTVAPPGTPVVDESAVDANRPDFITKGINRAD